MNTRIFSKFGKTFAVGIVTLLSVGMFASVASATSSTGMLISPNGGDKLSGTQTITWKTTGCATGDTVNLVLGYNGSVVATPGSTKTIGSSLSCSSGSYSSWNTDDSSIGDRSDFVIQIERKDSSGTQKETDSSDGFFTIDNTAPTTGYSILPLSPNGDHGWYTSNPTVTLTCTDATSGCNKIDYGSDGATTPLEAFGNNVAFVPANGEHQIVWRATDNAGNVETLKGPQLVKVDTIAPGAPAIDSIAGGDGWINTSEAPATIVTGTAEANSTVYVALSDGITFVDTTTTADGSGNYSVTLDVTSLTDGTITPSVMATDDAGNDSAITSAPTAEKDTDTPITMGAPDLITDTGDSTIDDITANNASKYDVGICASGNLVTIYADTLAVGTATCGGDGSSATVTTSSLSDGVYDMTFTETDPAGNESAKSSSLSVTIDKTAPAVPVVTGITDDTGFSTSDGITNDDTLKFNGTTPTDTTKVDVWVGSTYAGNTTVISSGAWSYDYTGTILPEGSYTITAKASDIAGNQS